MIVVLLAAGAALSVYASPALPDRLARLRALTLFAGLLAAAWLRQGLFMLSYYPMGGAFAGICLSSYAMGTCLGEADRPIHAALAGLALVGLVASAYSYLPSAMMFALAGTCSALATGRPRSAVFFGCGCAAGVLAVCVYSAIYVDPLGYFAFHVVESQLYYSRYIGFSWHQFRAGLALSAGPPDRIQSMAVIVMSSGLAATASARFVARSVPSVGLLRALPVLLGVLLLNARGSTRFQDGTFVMAAAVYMSVAVGQLLAAVPARLSPAATAGVASLVLGTEAFARGAEYTPFAMTRQEIDALPRWPIAARSGDPFFDHIRRLAGPDGRILALTYDPQFYLLADRLPMRGFYTYFRWDADYARAPWFGRGHDLCAALRLAPPPLIVFDDYPVWGFRPAEYMPCLFDVLRRSYGRDPHPDTGRSPVYVRNDLAASALAWP